MGIVNSSDAKLEGAGILLLAAQTYPLTRCSDYRGEVNQTGSGCSVTQEIREVFANTALISLSSQHRWTAPCFRKPFPVNDLFISLQTVLAVISQGTTHER